MLGTVNVGPKTDDEKIIASKGALIIEDDGTVKLENQLAEVDPDGGGLDGYATESFVQDQISKIPTPDVSGQIEDHNADKTAHNDIRTLVSNAQTAANTALEAVKKAGGGKSDFQKLIMGGM